MPTSAPDQNVSPPPTLVGPINDLCTGAFPLSLGESMEVSTIGANPEPRGLDTCDRRDVESMNTTRRSVWYSIAAESASSSSRRYRLDACNSTNSDIAPVHLTLYESNNNDCDILVCAVTLNNLGCTLEWDVLPSSSRQVLTSSRQVLTTTYKVLVEQIVPTNNTDIVAPFNISFSVANVPANDDCLRAETVQVGDIFNATALSATPETLETITTCERDNGDIFQHIANRDPIPGVWYRVVAGGRVRLLASACNSRRNDLVHVTVYTGSCLDLECLTDSSLSPRSCESVWDATSSESVYFILVERVLTSGFDPADFLFSIDIIGR